MNKVELSLIISKDYTDSNNNVRPAVKRVSDNLTTVQAYMPGRKQQDGTYGPSASLTVKVTSKTAVNVALAPQAHIDVTGFFSPESYTDKNGNTKTYFTLVANEIKETERSTNQEPQAASNTAPATENNAPAAESTPAPAPTAENTAPAANTAPAEAEDEDLPFF